MLPALGFAALIAIVGTFAGLVWAWAIKLAGAPGRLLAQLGTQHRQRFVVSAGTVLTSVIELYLLLAFAGVTSVFVAQFTEIRPALPAWPLWMAGWYLAVTPVLFTGSGAPGAQARDERDLALGVALPVAAVGYWIFVVAPRLLFVGWPWVPTIGW